VYVGSLNAPHYSVVYGLSGCTIFFPTLSHKRHDFLGEGGEVTEPKMCFDFLYNFCLKHFSFEDEFREI